MDKKTLFAEIQTSVVRGEAELLPDLAGQSLAIGISPLDTIDQAVTPAIREVGDRFGRGDAFLPELIMAGNAAMAILEVLNAEVEATGLRRQYVATVVMGTVEGDIHNIGKDIVISLCRANGFQVVDLGVDVPDEVFVQTVRDIRPDLLGLSALMTTTMMKQRGVIHQLREAGIRDQVKVIVGGAPITPAWAEQIGADGTAADAASAIALIRRLLGIHD